MTNHRSSHRRWFSGFLRSDAGNVVMLFGLLLLPMLGCIGLAIDFGAIVTARNKAQVAADAAALQASGVARDLIKASDGSAASTAAAITEAKRRATLLFKVHANQSGLSYNEPNIVMTRSGQNIVTTVNYQVKTNTYLAKLFGQNSYQASGGANSKSSLPNYSDVYLALDVSQSMGIAATQDQMTKLYSAKIYKTNGQMQPTSCVFGCHAVESGFAESNSDVAKRNGIQLRIDVLREATKKIITTAQTDADAAPIYRIGLYAMGMTAADTAAELKPVATLSNNFATLSLAADSINLGPSKGNSYSDSYLTENLKSLVNIIPTSYDGSSQTNSKKYAFIITDGVRDIQSASQCVQTGNRCVSVINTVACDDMKKKNITVGVVYTTYLPIKPIAAGTDWYQVQVVNTGVAANISTSLKTCATPGWYYEASDAAGIDKAMQNMFAQTTFAPSLTN